MTTAAELVAEVRALGVELRADPDGNRLLVRPKAALPAALKERLREQKQQVLALLCATAEPTADRAPADAVVITDPEVRWRYEVMLPQVPPRGPIPLLLARPELRDQWRELRAQGRCDSCGEPATPGYELRPRPMCAPCQKAAELACNVGREGLLGPAP